MYILVLFVAAPILTLRFFFVAKLLNFQAKRKLPALFESLDSVYFRKHFSSHYYRTQTIWRFKIRTVNHICYDITYYIYYKHGCSAVFYLDWHPQWVSGQLFILFWFNGKIFKLCSMPVLIISIIYSKEYHSHMHVSVKGPFYQRYEKCVI